MKMRTQEAASLVQDETLDFVFIDADHSETGVRRDLEDWLPKVKSDGWILGHDINWPGVRKVVEQLCPGYLIGPDNTWARPKNNVKEAVERYLATDGIEVTKRRKNIFKRLLQIFRMNKKYSSKH